MTNDGKSWYDALQLSFRQNQWHGINTQYNYTLSKCEDYNSDNSRGRNNFPQANNPYNPCGEQGPVRLRRRHNFNFGRQLFVSGERTARRRLVGRLRVHGVERTAVHAEPRQHRPLGAEHRIAARRLPRRDRSTTTTRAISIRELDDLASVHHERGAGIRYACAGHARHAAVAIRRGCPGWHSRTSTSSSRSHCSMERESRRAGRSSTSQSRQPRRLPEHERSQRRRSARSARRRTSMRGNPVIAQGGPRAMQWAVKVIF